MKPRFAMAVPVKRWGALLVTASVLLLVSCGGRSQLFSERTWKSLDRRSSTHAQRRERMTMVDDLATNHLRVGLSEAELTSLLGAPDRHAQAVPMYVYLLGSASGVGFAEEHELRIILDEQHRVLEWRIRFAGE